MHFKDRKEAGLLLSLKLKSYRGKDIVVYALPRGGVITAFEIAKYLNAPLDLIITRKIGHPNQPEYALAAVSDNCFIVGSEKEILSVDKKWLKKEISLERKEIKRRKEKYLSNRKEIDVKNKIAILVDDGIATGLTMKAGIKELKLRDPKKIVVAVPVIPKSSFEELKKQVDKVVALYVPQDFEFLGAVGAYYDEFYPIEDDEVIKLLSQKL